QATVPSVGLTPLPASTRWAGFVQSSAAYWASRPPSSLPEPLAEGEALAEADAPGVGSAFSASVTARPCEVAPSVGGGEAAWSPSAAAPDWSRWRTGRK